MDFAAIDELVDNLDDQIGDLEESLDPYVETATITSTGKLPLLDRAKVYVLIVYSIESILFSCIRLNGIDAKEHPVFQELRRVKSYFEKLRSTEEGPKGPKMRLDKSAANRFIMHALSQVKQDSTGQAQGNSTVDSVGQASDQTLKRKAIESAEINAGPITQPSMLEDGSNEISVDTTKLDPIGSSNSASTKQRKKAKKQRVH